MRKFLIPVVEMLLGKFKKSEHNKAVQENTLPKIEKKHKKTGEKKEKRNVPINSIKRDVPLISSQKMKLISLAGDIRLDPDNAESAFMARQLVQATLPHKNPGDKPAWSRKNGNLTLTVRPGWNLKKDKTIGYPYGTLPRLLLFWLTTEAIRTNSPRIELGNSLAHFMEKLGLDTSRGGKRSDAKRLKEQMMRLFRATISFDQSLNDGRESWIDMQVAPKGMLCWDERYPDREAQWESYIQLGEDFFNAIKSSPVPVDMRALKALKKSPLALDLYAWATYTAYQTQKTGTERNISWKQMHEQFGAEYSTVKNFSNKAWNALSKVQLVYPNLNIKRISGGIKVLPSKTAVIVRQNKKSLSQNKLKR